MPDIAIHQLPVAGALSGSEDVPVDNGIATVRTTVAAIRSGLAAADHAHALADVGGLQAALSAKAPSASPAFTGTVSIPTGSATAPAISPAGDPDTGLFAPAADVLAVSTGGVERLRIASDGTFQVRPNGSTYLGIVPESPHLAANTSSIGLVVADGGGVSGLFVNNNFDGTYSSQDIRFKTAQGGVSASTERMRIAADGVVTLGGTPGTESLRVVPQGGANRAVTATGSNGGDPTLATTGGRIAFGAVPALPSYTVATLPTAAARGVVYVSDGASSRRLAVADGITWRWPDGTAVS